MLWSKACKIAKLVYAPNFVKNHFFLMKLDQNVQFNDKNLLKSSFFNICQNFPIFPDFQIFSPKMAISGQLWPKIPDRDTQLAPSNVLICNLLLCIYH